MKKAKYLAVFGIWMILGSGVNGMDTGQMIWPGWSQEVEWKEAEGEESDEGNEDVIGWWETDSAINETERKKESVESKDEWEEYTEAVDNWKLDDNSDENRVQETQKDDKIGENRERVSSPEMEEKKIWVSDIHVAEEARYYDGTTDVKVEARVEGLPDGMKLIIIGNAKQKDAGTWPVETEVYLEGPGSDSYTVETEPIPSTLTVTILPKPLQITISNARKPYFSENQISELIFEEKEYLKVTGFLKEDCENGKVPDGFVFPELEIDEQVLQKESPMYRNGKEICYQNAVVLKKKIDGKISGNPTANYTFNIEENGNVTGGNVIISAATVTGTLDYTIGCSDEKAIWQAPDGKLWVRQGETLSVMPVPGKGYTEGTRIGQILGEGETEFRLVRKGEQGEILAKSQICGIAWHADGSAPEAGWALDGKEINSEGIYYCNKNVSVSCTHVSDTGSGVKKVELYVAYEDEMNLSGDELYEQKLQMWSEEKDLTVNREGKCRVWGRLEDMVGNVRYLCTGEIVTDHSMPEIQFENILPGSANRQKVEPICIIRERNLDDEKIKLTLTGFHGGIRQVQWEKQKSGNESMLVKMKNLPEEKEWDDMYTLKVECEDLAGNYSRGEIRFSVNRFGSVYYLDEKTEELTGRYYLSDLSDLKVYEVNVDDLTESDIILGHEGKTRQLVKDRDYTVRKSGDEQSWKEYCYTISAGCFEEEGMYYVICASEDRAENTSDNRMRKQKIEFAVDKSGPEILLEGVEKDGIYQEAKKKIQLECRDNLALQEVTVWLNGKEIRKNKEEEQEILIQKAEKWQTIRVVAEDRAGNKTDTGEQYFWLHDQKEAVPFSGEQHRSGGMADVQGKRKQEQNVLRNTKENDRKIMVGVAIITVFWAIFLKSKKHK